MLPSAFITSYTVEGSHLNVDNILLREQSIQNAIQVLPAMFSSEKYTVKTFRFETDHIKKLREGHSEPMTPLSIMPILLVNTEIGSTK